MLNFQQEQILTNLLKTKSLKYSEAKPEGMEKDLYNYHLGYLQEKGYIEKVEGEYLLTDIGKKYVQQLDFKGKSKEYFKASVIAISERMVDGKVEILMQKRLRHPYYGDYGYGISGKILPGEKIEVAASRKLKEETNLEGTFKFLGVIRKIRFDKSNTLIEDTLYHICLSSDVKGELLISSEAGEHEWVSVEVLKDKMKSNITSGETDNKLLDRIFKEKDFSSFYFTEELHLTSF